jgi:hypothetical protein
MVAPESYGGVDVADAGWEDVAWLAHRADVELSGVRWLLERGAVGSPLVDVLAQLEVAQREAQAAEGLALALLRRGGGS